MNTPQKNGAKRWDGINKSERSKAMSILVKLKHSKDKKNRETLERIREEIKKDSEDNVKIEMIRNLIS